MSNRENLAAAIAKIQQKLNGVVRIETSDSLQAAFHVRRPFGLTSLDLELAGGLPGGSVCQIHGPDGVGKDALTNYLLAENQRLYGEESAVFWASFGYPADLPFFRLCGVQVHHSDQELSLMGIDPRTASAEQRGPQIGQIYFPMLDSSALALEAPSENIMDAVIELINTGLFQIGIINEIASGESKDDVTKSLTEDPRMAAWARLMSAFCRRFYTVIKKPLGNGEPNLTTPVIINPVRANLDAHSAKYKPFIQPAGHALQHAKAIDIHLRVKQQIKHGTEVIGKEVGWKVAKGKHGIGEGAEGTYVWLHGQGIDLVLDTATVAKQLGVMTQRGATFTIEGVDGSSRGGFDAFVERLRENEPLLQAVREKVIQKIQSPSEDAAE